MRILVPLLSLCFATTPAWANKTVKGQLLCSTVLDYLMPPTETPQMTMINIGHRLSDGRYLLFQNPENEGRVPLDPNFIYFNFMSDMIPALVEQKLQGAPVDVIKNAAQAEWIARKDSVMFSQNFGVMKGPLVKVTPQMSNDLDVTGDYETLVIDPINKMLETLYQSYADQGPERAELLPSILRQDEEESERFVRFIISRFVKPMGYLQLLISKDPSEPLHITEAWGDQVKDLERKSPGEVIGEIGRLHVIHPNDFHFDYHRDYVMELTKEDGKLKTNRAITHLLFQKTLAYVNSDARLDRLLLQINKKVERVMLLNEIPLRLAERREVTGVWSGQPVTEVIYSFDKAALLKLEEFMMAKTMYNWFRYIQSEEFFGAFFRQFPEELFQVRFFPNEIPVLRRLGIYEHLMGKGLPASLPHDEIAFYMSIRQIPRALEYLDSRVKDIK